MTREEKRREKIRYMQELDSLFGIDSGKHVVGFVACGSPSAEYITKRFRCLSPIERVLVSNLYGRLYGSSAQAYFNTTYPRWISGAVSASSKTFDRVLECVPLILNKDEKIELVLLEVQERIDSVFRRKWWHCSSCSTNCHSSGLHLEFEEIIREELTRKDTLRWFTENILSYEEVASFNTLANYIVCSYLKKVYEGVVRDIELARNMVNGSSYQVDAHYSVDILGREIDLKANRYIPRSLSIDLDPPPLASEFSARIGAFVLECQIELSKQLKAGEIKRTTASRDVTSINRSLSQMNDVHRVDVETSHKVESGTIRLKTTKLNVGQIRDEISSLEKKKTIAILVSLCSWIYPPLGICVTLFSILCILDINTEIKNKKMEIDEYAGKQFL